MFKALIAAAAVTVLAASSDARAETALQATVSCREVVKGLRPDGVAISAAGQFCWGAFAVLQGLTRIKLSDHPTDLMLHVCAGEKVTRSQMILVFLKYADNNPAKLDDDFAFIATVALQQAFPCR